MLLSRSNVDQAALLSYAREAADFSTNHQLPKLDFAINHYGQPDVAMFDFTCMYASENAALVRQRNGHQLLVALVGDSLLEVREKDRTMNNGTKMCFSERPFYRWIYNVTALSRIDVKTDKKKYVLCSHSGQWGQALHEASWRPWIRHGW